MRVVPRPPLKARIVAGALVGRLRLVRYSEIATSLAWVGHIRLLDRISRRHLREDAAALWKVYREEGPVAYYTAFLRAVAKHDLLPIHDGYVEEIEEISTGIPLYGLGVDYEDVENLPDAILVILHLLGEPDYVDLPVHKRVCARTGGDMCHLRGACGGSANLAWLERLPRRGAWRGLKWVVRYAVKSTNNGLLDYCERELYEGCELPGWEDFEGIAALWKRAKRLDTAVWRVLKWIDEEPGTRLVELAKTMMEAFANHARAGAREIPA